MLYADGHGCAYKFPPEMYKWERRRPRIRVICGCEPIKYEARAR
jgi:hypothetical protein